MAAKTKPATTVGGYVDETSGKVVVYVEHDGRKLPVAVASLDYAASLDFDPDNTDDNTDDKEGGS